MEDEKINPGTGIAGNHGKIEVTDASIRHAQIQIDEDAATIRELNQRIRQLVNDVSRLSASCSIYARDLEVKEREVDHLREALEGVKSGQHYRVDTPVIIEMELADDTSIGCNIAQKREHDLNWIFWHKEFIRYDSLHWLSVGLDDTPMLLRMARKGDKFVPLLLTVGQRMYEVAEWKEIQ
jgi:hypothetical protein